MRHAARPSDAHLRSVPGEPAGSVLPSGVHELVPGPRPALLFVPPAVDPATPLLVYFHGAGGTATTSLPVVQAVAAAHGCLVLLPTSTMPTWDLIAGGWGPDVDRLDALLAQVFGQFAVSTVAVGGFSDGASYALSIGLANGELARTILAFSPGFAMPPDQVGTPRVWISHGTEDAVLPIDRCGRPTARRLREAGYRVNYQEFAGPHRVPPDLVDQAVRWWLAEQ